MKFYGGGSGGSVILPASSFRLLPDGVTWELIAPYTYTFPDAGSVTVQELRYDMDPLVYANVLVNNPSAINQIYSIGFVLPTVWAAPNLIRGSIDTSLIGTAATVSALANSSIYSAQIDLSTVATLQNSPFSLFTPQQAVSSSAAFGFNPSAIPVTSSIGIELRFQLTPGDTAAFLSDFEVTAVPEPGVLTLLVLGAGALALRRARR